MGNDRYAALRALIAKNTDDDTSSREQARQQLIAEGIYTATGEISPEYGGRAKSTSKNKRQTPT